MRLLMAMLLAVAGMAAVMAEPAEPTIPGIDEVIVPRVSKLSRPEFATQLRGMKMAISGADNLVQAHVLHGIELLLAGWDFEAYRHFCAALSRDPECLMAHWGIAVALAQPAPGLSDARDAAVERMAELAQRKIGSELERGYAVCLLMFYREGAATAAEAFRKLSEQFPNDPLPAVYAALLGRGGYDSFGNPTPDQERAEKLLLKQLERQPDNPVVNHVLLMIRAEAGSLGADLERVRQLCRQVPEMPTYQHMLGHYEWRCGNFGEAVAAFGRAAAIYSKWMESTGLGPEDCPGWTRTEVYRCVALASRGDYDAALKAAAAMMEIPIKVDQVGGPGTAMLMWEARTLPARLRLARDQAGDPIAGLESLPKPGDPELVQEKSDASFYYQGLVALLEGHKALADKDLDRAGQIANALTMLGSQMSERRGRVAANGELSHWRRALDCLQIQAAELRGDIAMAGPQSGRGSAYNWFLSAVDRQRPATMLLPPAVLESMRVRAGEFLLGDKRPDAAAEKFREALESWPGNRRAQAGLERALGKEKPVESRPEPVKVTPKRVLPVQEE